MRTKLHNISNKIVRLNLTYYKIKLQKKSRLIMKFQSHKF